ncbi:MAG: 1-acyl-sn-glycerol-3-phosphate acyltransferase [Thermosynechococcaceae cyanobacterium]
MPQTIHTVQPPLKFLPHKFDPVVIRVVKFLLPAWMRYRLSIGSIETKDLEILVDLYQKFQAGNLRMLLTFRHPGTADPFVMAYLLWYAVPQAAKKMGVKFKHPIRSFFMYDRGIPLWAGEFVSWLFPRLGGTSIFRGKADRQGLRAARDLLANGHIPLSVAPEGGTNEHSELVAPLEPGAAQLGFWCAEDLAKANRSESVYIVPIGIQYAYMNLEWSRLEALLTEMEQSAGVSAAVPVPTGLIPAPQADVLYGRLLRLSDRILDVMELFYSRYYHRTFPDLSSDPEIQGCCRNQYLAKRLKSRLEVALQVAEDYFGQIPKGTLSDRCRQLEQAGWNRIYRDDVAQLSPLEQGLADWVAEEASIKLGHMRLVERISSVTQHYIVQKPTVDRFAEVILIVWKVIENLKGGDPHSPPNLGLKSLRITAGKPLSVTDRWPTYKKDRRHARQEIESLTQELKASLEQMIV